MSLRVIGAGFGRTGTMSLKVALEQLGFGPCYHMVECLPKGPEHYRLWEEAVAGKADWDAIFAPHWMAYLPNSMAGPFMKSTINDFFDNRMHDREFLIMRFNEHVAEVQARIPADRLLTFEVKQGWSPLCEFLEVPVPAEPFPHINDTAETQAIINNIIEHGFERAFAQ